MTVNEIRNTYLEFFESKDHLRQKSASLLPAHDPTLLFTTAGMVPFKDYFAGIAIPPHARLASVQKCFRTTDLEEVGKTQRHLSFFEMLGNFSFGDYFKKEAIEFAWEYSTQVLKFPVEDIFISIYKDDDEAYDLWHKHIGIDPVRIVRLDEKDNFWGPAGDTGACGPCSELYLDRGPAYGEGPENSAPGGEGERFLEFWNLVFNQFNKNESGEMLPLKQTGIDTGAGLERLAALLQGVGSVYDTDELKSVRDEVARIYAANYVGDDKIPIRVLTDHARALTFAIADGIYPSNESRGYVLRRMLRRALLFGRRLGQNEPLLYKLVDTVTRIYGKFYPELNDHQQLTTDYIEQEEKRFLKTLESGAQKLEEFLEQSGSQITGKDAFLLYDTFGFPLEMTIEMAQQRGLSVDTSGFDQQMQQQKERGRQAWRGGAEDLQLDIQSESEFAGYDDLEIEARVVALAEGGQLKDSLTEDTSEKTVVIVTDKTCFYPESGGQVGDTGHLNWNGGGCEIIDTQKHGDAILHIASRFEGSLSTGEPVKMTVTSKRRSGLAKNHSATHLLNAALRNLLGEHVKQSGSLVAEDYLRFDFTHPKAMSSEEIKEVELVVNEAIDRELPVTTEVMPIEQAEKSGAMMTFGEKYGDTVRVVTMGDNAGEVADSAAGAFSKEFCGGTHVPDTAVIEAFIIQKESSPGAGNRRIEAMTGKPALNRLNEEYNSQKQALAQLQQQFAEEKLKDTKVEKELTALLADLNSIEKSIADNAAAEGSNAVSVVQTWHRLREKSDSLHRLQKEIKKLAKKQQQKPAEVSDELIQSVLDAKETVQNIETSFFVKENSSIPELKSLADALRERDADTVFILCGYDNHKYNIVTACTRKTAQEKKYDLGKAFKTTMSQVPRLKGGGGGKNEMAQGSGACGELDTEEVKAALQEFSDSFIQNLKSDQK